MDVCYKSNINKFYKHKNEQKKDTTKRAFKKPVGSQMQLNRKKQQTF